MKPAAAAHQSLGAKLVSSLSGANSDAILYLGAPDTLTLSPIDPNIYLDPDYFKEENRRLQCCTPNGKPLDFDQILRRNSLVPKKLEVLRRAEQ